MTELTKQTPSRDLVSYFEGRRNDFEDVLQKGVSVETFMRTFKNAVLKDPKIAEADPTSVFLEVQKAAQDGLVLDGREAVLTRFNTRYKADNGKWESKTAVAYIPMIHGIRKRVMNSGQIKMWTVGLVYEAEYRDGHFRWRPADLQPIHHEPMIIGDRGPVIAAYSLVRLNDNTFSAEVMNIDDLTGIMNRSKSKDADGNVTGPWKTDRAEMYKKTVARRHSKNLPMSADDRRVVERLDTALYDFERDADDVYAEPPPATPQAVANKRKGSAADKMRAAKPATREDVAEVPHDEDGVLLDGEIMNDGDNIEPEDVF